MKYIRFFEFRSFSFASESFDIGTTITLTTDNDIRNYEFSLDYDDLTYFIVLPYTKNEKLEQQVDVKYNGEDGIYLSHQMAEKMELLEEHTDTVNMVFDIGIPVRKFEFIYEEDGETKQQDQDILEYREMDISVSGVLNDNVYNRYSINGDNVVYVPYEMLYGMLESAIAESENNEYPITENSYVVKEWSASALLVYTNSYKEISVVQGKIENIDGHFATRYDFQDTVSMDALMATIGKTTRMLLVIVLAIIFILMSSVFISTIFERRREIAVLKANGMTNVNLIRLMLIESIIQGVKIIVVATLLAAVLSAIGNMLLLSELAIFTAETIVYIVFIAILFVLVPSIASVTFTMSVQPDKILRN